MIRFLRWLDDVLFSPPHPINDVIRQILPLLESDHSASGATPPAPREKPAPAETSGVQPPIS